MTRRSIVITSTLVGVLATGAHAQRADAPRNTPQQQAQGLRQASHGRLIVPISATLTTPTTSTEPTASSMAQVTGSFSIQRFAQTTAGEVAAVGMLTLNLVDPSSGSARAIVTEVAMRAVQSVDESSSLTSSSTRSTTGTSAVVLGAESRARPTASTQGCETLSLTLRPVQLDLLGMAVRLDQVNVDFISRTTGQLRSLLCGTTSVMDRGVGPAERMNRLNALLDVVG
jgi:hypothetical protein